MTMITDNNFEDIKQDLLGVISFLISSAIGLREEPKRYGPIRLAYAAKKLTDVIVLRQIDGPFFEDLSVTFNEKLENLLHDEDQLQSFLLEISKKVTLELMKHLDENPLIKEIDS